MDRLPLQRYGECSQCNRFCEIFDGVAPDLDLSGLPCVDQSPAGRQLFEEGKTKQVFVCHAKLNIEKGTRLILIENVPDSN